MSWKEEIKKQNRIDATTMYFPKYADLMVDAMERLLQKHYSSPELQIALIEMMNYIDRYSS